MRLDSNMNALCANFAASGLEWIRSLLTQNAPMVPSWIRIGFKSASVAFLNSSYETNQNPVNTLAVSSLRKTDLPPCGQNPVS
jgi:hypothetical protein